MNLKDEVEDKTMRFFVMGGTGFIGGYLLRFLVKKGHEVTALSRSRSKAENLPSGVKPLVGDPLSPGEWQEEAASSQVIINLVGRPILARWTRQTKEEILETRVRSTQMAVQSIPRKRASEMTLINANAVGYYGSAGNEIITEENGPGKGFLAHVTVRWQQEAEMAREKGARVVVSRFGAVLGRGGGAFGQMLPPFQLGVGGRLGSGRQWFSWIHVMDLVRAILFVAEEREIDGVVNMVSPNPVTNLVLTKTLARLLNRPAILPVPGFVLKLAIGGAAEIALDGQRVVPAVLERAGFPFNFPTLEEALRDLLGK